MLYKYNSNGLCNIILYKYNNIAVIFKYSCVIVTVRIGTYSIDIIVCWRCNNYKRFKKKKKQFTWWCLYFIQKLKIYLMKYDYAEKWKVSSEVEEHHHWQISINYVNIRSKNIF